MRIGRQRICYVWHFKNAKLATPVYSTNVCISILNEVRFQFNSNLFSNLFPHTHTKVNTVVYGIDIRVNTYEGHKQVDHASDQMENQTKGKLKKEINCVINLNFNSFLHHSFTNLCD